MKFISMWEMSDMTSVKRRRDIGEDIGMDAWYA